MASAGKEEEAEMRSYEIGVRGCVPHSGIRKLALDQVVLVQLPSSEPGEP